MYTALVIIILFILGALFLKCYHEWKRGKPILFTLLIGTVGFAGVLLGNTVFTDSFPINSLYQWATVDAVADGPLGAAQGVFFIVMFGIAFALSVLFGLISKYGGAYIQKPYIFIPYMLIVFGSFVSVAAPVGINLSAIGIDVMSPTKEVAGKLAGAVLKAAADGVIETANQLEDVVDEKNQRDAADPSDFEPAVERDEERSDKKKGSKGQ